MRGKTPRPQNGCGVIYCTCVKTPVRAELTVYHRPLRRCVVFCDTLFPTSTLSEFVFRYLPGRFAGLSWSFSIGRYRTCHADGTVSALRYLLGELSMWIRSLHFTSTTVHPVEVHKQSHQASRRARTLEYCPRSCAHNTCQNFRWNDFANDL